VKVLVTGAGGQVGRALLAQLGARGVGLDRAALPIENVVAVAKALGAHKPDAVINAAAYTHVDRAETEVEAAYRANRDGVATLARACQTRGVRLVHISTDYVFDGTRDQWTEDDPTTPLNIYGASKLAGEKAVRAEAPSAAIVRTSWVFSAGRRSFVTAVLALARARPVVRMVDDQHGSPTHADDLARALIEVAGRPEVTGVLHYCGHPPTTWYGFARTIIDDAGLATTVRIDAIPSAKYPSPAWRPRSSVLDTSLARALGLAPAPWRDGLRAVLRSLP
jgi:dTDP-4-dehydrorhamnose reductase